MAITIVSPRFSFIQFETSDVVQSCSHPGGITCLPVYAEDDIAFQFIARADTAGEADALCTLSGSGVVLGLTRDGVIADSIFAQQPDRYRLNSLEILFNWSHGVPGFTTVVDLAECFYIYVLIDSTMYVSNCLKRINDTCYTSVIEYGAEDNVFGFAYCGGVELAGDAACEPQFISFTNQTVVNIPYTASMIIKWGNIPSVAVWIYNENAELQLMNVAVTYDTYPPTLITINLGGLADGVIKLS